MQDPGGENQIEHLTELAHVAQVQLVELKIVEPVLLLKESLVREAGLREIDAHDGAVAVGVGKHGRLHRAASGNQNAQVPPRATLRPDLQGKTAWIAAGLQSG